MCNKALDSARREKKIMEMLEHGNLTKCHASFEDEKNFVIVTEMMNCDLHSLLNKINAPVQEEFVCKIFFQMVLAVDHMH